MTKATDRERDTPFPNNSNILNSKISIYHFNGRLVPHESISKQSHDRSSLVIKYFFVFLLPTLYIHWYVILEKALDTIIMDVQDNARNIIHVSMNLSTWILY